MQKAALAKDMPSYLTLVAERTLSRSLVRTDIFAAVVAALSPVVFHLAGKPMPGDWQLQSAIGVAAIAGFVILLRLITAPYLIWKADQATIKKLQDELDDPKRKRAEAMRALMAKDRMNLTRALARLQGDLRELNSAFLDSERTLVKLREIAGPMLVLPAFKRSWLILEQNLKHVGALHKYKAENPNMDRSMQVKSLRRFSVHFANITGAISILVALLVEGDLEAAKAEVGKRAESFKGIDVDYSFAMPDFENYFEDNMPLIDEHPGSPLPKEPAIGTRRRILPG